MPEDTPLTRRTARRFTRKRVKVEDGLARFIITVGGIGTIAAILAVGVFLIWVSWPLFLPPKSTGVRTVAVDWDQQAPTRVAVDENSLIGWVIEHPGVVRVFRLSDGLLLAEQPLADETSSPVTAWTPARAGTDQLAIGLADGQARVGHIRVVSQILTDQQAQQALATRQAMNGQPTFPYQDGLAEQLPDNRVRTHRVEIELETAFDTGIADEIRLLDYVESIRGSRLAILSEKGRLALIPLRARTTLLGRAASAEPQTIDIGYDTVRAEPPNFLVSSDAQLYIAWSDGLLARFDVRVPTRAALVETIDLVPSPQVQLTALVPLIGRGTLIAGDSSGRTNAWFVAQSADEEAQRLTLAHALPAGDAAVSAIAASDRSRLIAVGYDSGQVDLMHVTSARRLVRATIDQGTQITGLAIAPREDGVLTVTDSGLGLATVLLQHPEATLAALFTPVWYQDYSGPAHVWQSTSGGQANEPKLGVMPLVFGTIKATAYSLLFGVPIALLAAVFTSEFLSREARGRIKPTIELMAGLPSVVLGYLAAFVVAPLVARFVPAVLVSFLTIPFAFLLAAYLLQLFPQRLALWSRSYRFPMICAVLPLGAALAVVIGPRAESFLFGGNLIRWLDSGDGPATGGWLMLLLPVSAIAVGYLTAREVTPLLRRISANWDPGWCALLDLLKFVCSASVIVALALGTSLLLNWLGYDPRGTFIGPYIQRNAMIVGFAMGFAIIPLIYTIADDALSSVPEHLRSASLGAGATPWQTTIRIIVPTAMSGLFSAVMIGLGRAVGETMIVLMAAGNTPIMEWNIFNGFRTLSANLAVELPEAEQGSTHFRVLFMTALLLFAMTFLVNTLAEVVRQRFRKRAYQL